MVDVCNQYQKIKEEVDAAIHNVIDKGTFIRGDEVHLFEQELAVFHGSKHAIACANGTDALQIALMSLGLQPGDEVISPDFTFVSTIEAAALLRLKPVLADIEPHYFTISPKSIEKKISSKTKAIIPVHLFGQCADMDEVLSLAKSNNLYVVEDNAQSIGSEYAFSKNTILKAGNIGDIGCTSFFPSKNLGCFGDGGALTTNNDELAERIRGIANHGMKVKYVNHYIGVNSRLDTIQAAVLRIKLRHLDQYILERKKVASFYNEKLQKLDAITIPARRENSMHVYNQYTILLDPSVNRDEFRNFLEKKSVPSMIYYPRPMHRQKAYKYLESPDCHYPVTNDITGRIVSLPIHTEMDNEQLEYISDAIHSYFK